MDARDVTDFKPFKLAAWVSVTSLIAGIAVLLTAGVKTIRKKETKKDQSVTSMLLETML